MRGPARPQRRNGHGEDGVPDAGLEGLPVPLGLGLGLVWALRLQVRMRIRMGPWAWPCWNGNPGPVGARPGACSRPFRCGDGALSRCVLQIPATHALRIHTAVVRDGRS